MKEFIEYLIKSIVKDPEAVIIKEEKEGDSTVYTIVAAKDDIGGIIGKKGRVINSIRNVAKIKAIRDNVHIRIEIEDGRPELEREGTTDEVSSNNEDNE
jgi:predicted RNA-binding protein YlqC (UPF0109 family)